MYKPTIKCPVADDTGEECGRPAKGQQEIVTTETGRGMQYDCGLHKFMLFIGSPIQPH